MLLEKYLGKRKIELLKQEFELSTVIQLKIFSYWLINKDQFQEVQMTGNKQSSAIVFMVKRETIIKKLCALGLYFRSLIRIIEEYWKTR